MFNDPHAEPHRGTQGSSRQGWSKVNVRAVIYRLKENNLAASQERLARLLYEQIQADEDVGMSASDWLVALCLDAWRANQERAKRHAEYREGIDPKTREAKREETETKIAKAVEAIREQFLLLNWEMPNGKRLRFCEGNYVATLGGGLGRAGRKAGKKLMGQVFDEKSLRKYVPA